MDQIGQRCKLILKEIEELMGAETGQLLWVLNTILFAAFGFFVKNWMSARIKELEKIEARMDRKLDSATCLERNGDMKKECEKLRHHRHVPITGEKGGEVILL